MKPAPWRQAPPGKRPFSFSEQPYPQGLEIWQALAGGPGSRGPRFCFQAGSSCSLSWLELIVAPSRDRGHGGWADCTDLRRATIEAAIEFGSQSKFSLGYCLRAL